MSDAAGGSGGTGPEDPTQPRSRIGLVVASALLGLGRGIYARLPERIQRGLEHRFFYSVFHVTRVTNDHYGWKPDDPGPQQRPEGWQHPWEVEEGDEDGGDGGR